uniref:PiggyBac transposable element-derived protein 4 n=1 Tax=Sipha flava TaxID=143950 RepID=A0A2S2Q9N5_9HEMI
MRALFGLLYIAGMMKSNHLNLSDLWSNDGLSPEYFRAVMSKTRFYLLLRALRFDNINTRSERKKFDKLAPIRTIFDEFVDRCKLNYTVGEYCTIDEILEGFRGKCNFRQYIPNKPNKYGIKIFSLVDAHLFYTTNIEVYVGKQPNGPYNQDISASSIVKRMISPISKTGRNLSIDNRFTSVPLAVDLLQNHKITMVGTIRKNKREIPPIFLDTKKREVNSSKFGYSKECLLVSYVPKKNKNVLMLSIMHKH